VCKVPEYSVVDENSVYENRFAKTVPSFQWRSGSALDWLWRTALVLLLSFKIRRIEVRTVRHDLVILALLQGCITAVCNAICIFRKFACADMQIALIERYRVFYVPRIQLYRAVSLPLLCSGLPSSQTGQALAMTLPLLYLPVKARERGEETGQQKVLSRDVGLAEGPLQHALQP
jgi:hypothetical protein